MICTKCAKVIHKKKGEYCITAKGPHHYECPPVLIESQDLTRQMTKSCSQVLYEQQQAHIAKLERDQKILLRNSIHDIAQSNELLEKLHAAEADRLVLAEAVIGVAEWSKKFVNADYWETWQKSVLLAGKITQNAGEVGERIKAIR